MSRRVQAGDEPESWRRRLQGEHEPGQLLCGALCPGTRGPLTPLNAPPRGFLLAPTRLGEALPTQLPIQMLTTNPHRTQ